MLHMMPKKAADILWKVVKSAASNAEHNADADLKTLLYQLSMLVEVCSWKDLDLLLEAECIDTINIEVLLELY